MGQRLPVEAGDAAQAEAAGQEHRLRLPQRVRRQRRFRGAAALDQQRAPYPGQRAVRHRRGQQPAAVQHQEVGRRGFRQQALRVQQQRGAGAALLLNTQGLLAEASAANLLVLHRGRLLTPPVADGALPGIRRALLIERCGAAEASLPPDALREAEAVFLASSLGLRGVASLDGQALPQRDDLVAELDRRTR